MIPVLKDVFDPKTNYFRSYRGTFKVLGVNCHVYALRDPRNSYLCAFPVSGRGNVRIKTSISSWFKEKDIEDCLTFFPFVIYNMYPTNLFFHEN